LSHHNILLNDSDEEVDPAQFEHYDDDDDDDDNNDNDDDEGNHVVYTSIIPEDDDFDTSLDSDVIIDYRMSALSNWNNDYADDNDNVRTSTERFHTSFPTSTGGKAVFAGLSTQYSSPRLSDKSENLNRLKIADPENRKRKSQDDEPQSVVKHSKKEQDQDGDMKNTSELDINSKPEDEKTAEHLLSETHGVQQIDVIHDIAAAVPVTGKMVHVTASVTPTNKLQSGRPRPVMNPVKTAGCCQHSVTRSGRQEPSVTTVADTSLTTESVAMTLSNAHAPSTVASHCHPITSTVNGHTQSNSIRYTTAVSSSTCDRHCGNCLIPTLSSATANLVSQTAMMGLTGPLALRHPAVLSRQCSSDQLLCCGGGTVKPEIPSSSWSGVFPCSPVPTASSSMRPLSYIQYRPPHLGLPPASKQWPTATVVPITSMTSSPISNQQEQLPKAKHRKKTIARLPRAELVFGPRGIPETNLRPPMEPHVPSQSPVIVGNPLPPLPDLYYRPPVSQPVANVGPQRDSNKMNQLSRTSHPLLSSSFQPHQLTAPGVRVLFDGSKTSVLPTIDAAQHSQQVHLHQQQKQHQQHELNGECRTQYRYEPPMNVQPVTPSHAFRQTSTTDASLAPDNSSTASGNLANSRGMVTGEGGARANANNMPKLPFPLPPVPPGYRLVITHHSLPSNDTQTTTAPQVTQLIIDNPAAEAMAAGNCSPPGQSKVATSMAETGVGDKAQVNGEDAMFRGASSSASVCINYWTSVLR